MPSPAWWWRRSTASRCASATSAGPRTAPRSSARRRGCSQRERYDNIVLEVSEKDSQLPGVGEALTAFRAGGGRLAVDDVGSGFINLRDVLTLKPDILKVDRALIRGIDRDRVKAAIVEGLNAMAKQLEIPLLAEGIESREELAVLEGLGVPLGQGYLFGEPSPSFTGQSS